jgi:DNA-binding PadR family transcriptional regulator
LSFGDELTGYEVRQRAEQTYRYFWVAPAMSQIYKELEQLATAGLVKATDQTERGRIVRRYRITAGGLQAVREWLTTAPIGEMAIKHVTALRLFLGHLVDEDTLATVLEAHARVAADTAAELATLVDGLDGDGRWRNARLVAEWGEAIHRIDAEMAAKLAAVLRERVGDR